MKKAFLIAIIATVLYSGCNNPSVIVTTGSPNSEQLNEYWDKAYKALNDSNYTDYLTYAEMVYKYSPENPLLKILYADALMSNNQQKEADQIVNSLLKLHHGSTYDLISSPQYTFLKKMTNYEELLNRAANDTAPINNSEIAFILAEKDLIPEGVAYDNSTRTLYISSIYKRKIVSISANGEVKDFISGGQDNILSVLGMEVDEQRRHLWVCSEWDNPRKILPDSLLNTGVFKYDLGTGKLIKKYILKDTSQRLLNDLTLLADGTVFITESLKGKVYVIKPEKDSLELFVDSDHYYYANGIAISDNEKYLYISHFGGTHFVDLDKNTVHKLKHPENIFTGRIDGLAYYKNSLIAHQIRQGEICRYYLNENGDSIIQNEVIERNNPLFDFPTTGELAGNDYYYIANAQLRNFDENGYVLADEKLDSVYILKTNLQK